MTKNNEFKKVIIKEEKTGWVEFVVCFILSTIIISLVSFLMMIPIVNVFLREEFNYGKNPFPRILDGGFKYKKERKVYIKEVKKVQS